MGTLIATADYCLLQKSAVSWADCKAASPEAVSTYVYVTRLYEDADYPWGRTRAFFRFATEGVTGNPVAFRPTLIDLAPPPGYAGSVIAYWQDWDGETTDWVDLATLTAASAEFELTGLGENEIPLINPEGFAAANGGLVLVAADEDTEPSGLDVLAIIHTVATGGEGVAELDYEEVAPPLPSYPASPEVDWTIPRKGTYRFVRVDYATRAELEELTTIQPGGTIVRNMETDLKESGTLSAVEFPEIGDDLVRIYYQVRDRAGAEVEIPLATMHAVKKSSKFTAAAQSCTVSLLSALLTMQDDKSYTTVTIPAGTNAIEAAVDIVTDLGLPVVATPSDKALFSDANFDPGTPALKVVNHLLDYAHYWSALVDEWGRVVFAPYQEPRERVLAWELRDGASCTFLPDVSMDSDAFDVPNVCVLTVSNAEESFSGAYFNADPSSPYSTVNRGRFIVLAETVTDAVDDGDLFDKAKSRLMLATSATEKYVFRHAYDPSIAPASVGACAWSKHMLAFYAAVLSQEIALNSAALTTTTVKRIWE